LQERLGRLPRGREGGADVDAVRRRTLVGKGRQCEGQGHEEIGSRASAAIAAPGMTRVVHFFFARIASISSMILFIRFATASYGSRLAMSTPAAFTRSYG